MSEANTLTFYGGAGTVTGSKYLIRAGDSKILLDAGLFQGLKELRLRNWADPAFDPAELDAIVLSHAHIDHSGYLPLLVKRKFEGKIHCTSGTADLLSVMLPDSARLQEEEAANANRHGYSKHKPALPIYTEKDAEAALKQLESHPYGERSEVNSRINVLFRRAGHILGAAIVELQIGRDEKIRLVYSGDLGRWTRPVIRDPEWVLEADVLLLESTYGNKNHPANAKEQFAKIIREAAGRKGAIIFPAFAVGRTQELLWMIRKLENEGKIPVLPVYFDSPMAIDVTAIYCKHPEDLDFDIEDFVKKNQPPFGTRRLHLAKTPEESKAINQVEGPFILISASGMATGGRVLHHLKQRLPDPKTTVVLAGYQAAGTRGRSMQDGAKTIRMHGENVPLRAKIEQLDGLSAHADQNEILKWLSGFKRPPQQTYLVHGETEATHELRKIIRKKLGWKVAIAQDQQTIALVTS